MADDALLHGLPGLALAARLDHPAALLARGLSEDALYVSMERNMKCGIGYCGHCQMGQLFVCKDGPVFRYAEIEPLFNRWEI